VERGAENPREIEMGKRKTMEGGSTAGEEVEYDDMSCGEASKEEEEKKKTMKGGKRRKLTRESVMEWKEKNEERVEKMAMGEVARSVAKKVERWAESQGFEGKTSHQAVRGNDFCYVYWRVFYFFIVCFAADRFLGRHEGEGNGGGDGVPA
jgi:hypothetical protein